MKNIHIAIFAFIILGFLSCKKDKIIGDVNQFTVGSYLTLQEATKLDIDFANRATESASIKVGSYGSPVQSVNIYMGEPSDTASWVFIKNVPFSEGVSLQITSAEIAAALGIPVDSLQPGSSFTFLNEVVTTDGRKFSLKNTSTNYEPFAGYNMALRWTANIVCPFSAPMAGSYEVLEDGWQDWSSGDIVEVFDGPGTNQINLSKVWPNPAVGDVVDPLVVDIADPATGAATIAEGITFGDYGAYKATTLDGSAGFVFSCTNTITLSIHIDASGYGDQGSFTLKLRKKL